MKNIFQKACKLGCTGLNLQAQSNDMESNDIVGTGKNNSTLTLGQCRAILADLYQLFESFSNADLDSLYFMAMGHWPYHLTRGGHIYWLNRYRAKNTAC